MDGRWGRDLVAVCRDTGLVGEHFRTKRQSSRQRSVHAAVVEAHESGGVPARPAGSVGRQVGVRALNRSLLALSVAAGVSCALALAACGPDRTVLSAAGCGETLAQHNPSGYGFPADLGIYFVPDVDDDHLSRAKSELLFQQLPGRTGEAMIDGVHSVQPDYGVRAIYVVFDHCIPESRLDEVAQDAEQRPDVVEVRRGVIVGE